MDARMASPTVAMMAFERMLALMWVYLTADQTAFHLVVQLESKWVHE
jgi:hypothetical protein